MSVAVTGFPAHAASQVATPGPANRALRAAGARFGLGAALPFVAGAVLGKQPIIRPTGFGVTEPALAFPRLFAAVKFACVGYISWLACRVANLDLAAPADSRETPGFLAGLADHPLNPRAWAMIVAGFTTFVTPGTAILQATAIMAICLLAMQVVFHPLWATGGVTLLRQFAGKPAERILMYALAGLMVASVVYGLFLGGKA